MTKELLNFFRSEYFKMYEAEYPVSWGKDMAVIKRLLTYYHPDTLKQYITGFFKLDDDFLKTAGYKVQFLQGRIPAIQGVIKKRVKEKVSTKNLDAEIIAKAAKNLETDDGDF
jgi:hypothetical protein